MRDNCMCLVMMMSLFCLCDSMSSNNYISNLKRARRANVPGNLFIDESCIDCDVCRWMCPSVYGRSGIKSAVSRQPITYEEKIPAYMAMISCPVGSIRLREPDPVVKDALQNFPNDIDPINIPGISHLGYHSAESYGASPYFVKRDDGRNIMIDTPRFSSRLADSLEAEGGVEYLVLTHRDDVHDHERWKKRFPKVQRVMHRLDAQKSAGTHQCEVLLEGLGEWDPEPNFKLIHTPGHTAGSICVLVETKGDSALFTGDTLAFSSKRGRLEGFKRYNKGSYVAQSESLRELADDKYEFTWILPGHGRISKFESLQEKKRSVLKCAEDFDKNDEDDDILGVGY